MRRTENAQMILDACDQWAAKDYLYVPKPEEVPQYAGCQHAYYKLYVYVQTNNLPEDWSRDRIINAFDNTGMRPKQRLPVAKQLGETSLMFLVHPTLTELEIEQTVEAINSVFSKLESEIGSKA